MADTAGMSPSMWRALGEMPVVLRRSSLGWTKPLFAPDGPSIEALQARAFVIFVPASRTAPPRYERTALGEAGWADR